MNVADLLQQKEATIYSTSPEETIFDAIQLLCEKHVGCLLVLDEEQNIEGILTERDILQKCGAKRHDPYERKVKHIMTPRERVIIGRKTDDIQYVMTMMTTNRIRHLPILAEGKIIGLISIGDVVKALLDKSEYDKKMLEDYITGKYPG